MFLCEYLSSIYNLSVSNLFDTKQLFLTSQFEIPSMLFLFFITQNKLVYCTHTHHHHTVLQPLNRDVESDRSPIEGTVDFTEDDWASLGGTGVSPSPRGLTTNREIWIQDGKWRQERCSDVFFLGEKERAIFFGSRKWRTANPSLTPRCTKLKRTFMLEYVA